MSKENYTVEEIIMGLRSVYLEQQKALSKLKEYVSIKDKRVTDFDFRIGQDIGQNPELSLRFDTKENKLEEWLYGFLQTIGFVPALIDRDESKVLRDFNKNFKISGYFKPYIKDAETFNQLVSDLMNAEFTQKISAQSDTKNVEVAFKQAAIHTIFRSNGLYKGTLWYYAKDDMIRVFEFDGASFILPDGLSAQFSTANIPKYHTNHIDAYLESPKGIIIEDTMSSAKSSAYKIVEDENTIILRRTN